MNQVILIGRRAKDPDKQVVPTTGTAVCNFTLAVNRIYSQEKEADFFRIVVWGKQAENAAKYLSKGSQCAISGSIHNNNYTDKDGVQRYSVDIQAREVHFLSQSNKTNHDDYYTDDVEIEKDDFPMIDDDDVPF